MHKTRNSVPDTGWMNPGSARYQVIFLIIVGVISGIAIYYYSGLLKWDAPLFGLSAHVDGVAPKPYIYRALIPLTVRTLKVFLPSQDVKLIASILLYFSLIGYILSMRYLAKAFWLVSIPIDIAVLLSPIALTPLMIVANHIYDLGILFLFTLGLALLAHARYKWFVILFPFICLAKETAILLTFFFAVFYVSRLNRRTYLRTLLLQGFVYVIVRAALTIAFRDNPGGNIDYHVSEWLLAISISPILLLSFYGILGFVIAILVMFYWKDKPIFLRYSVVVMVPILLSLHFMFGIPYELRVFYEVFPAIYLLSVFTIFKFIGIEMADSATRPHALV